MGMAWRLSSNPQHNYKAAPRHGHTPVPTTSTGTCPGCSHPAQFLFGADSCCAAQERAGGTAGFKVAPGETSRIVNFPVNRVRVETTLTNQQRPVLQSSAPSYGYK